MCPFSILAFLQPTTVDKEPLIEAKSHMTWLRKSNSCYTLRKSLQITSALSATSKLCFEQSAASFLVCSLIFIEY